MMGDQRSSNINHESHLLLDQPLLRLPYELLRKNFRSAHFTFEKESAFVKNLLKETATGSVNGKTPPEDVLKNLDTMLARMRGMKRKLATYADEEARLYHQVDARVAHLRELEDMHTVDDVKYEAWSRQRLDRLLIDYLLRQGYNRSAELLADERSMRDLVDIDTFVAMSKIQDSLRAGSVTEALAWCNDNKKELRKMDSKLEFMLRYQQYIELVRTQSHVKLLEAITHAKKFLIPYRDTYPREVLQAAGLLAFPPGSFVKPPPEGSSAAHDPPPTDLYSPSRWTELADLFTQTHNSLLALPSFPLLHIALSSGLSALKTPACHSAQPGSAAQPSHATAVTAGATSVCPVCSTELNALARSVPYAHHSKSHVEHDLVLLPNGRVYGRARLDEYARKAGLAPDMVKDLRTGDVFPADKLKKVYIT